MDFKHLTDAVVVGEQTAGKPNHFGEVRNFQLPGSKLTCLLYTSFPRKAEVAVVACCQERTARRYGRGRRADLPLAVAPPVKRFEG